MKINDNYNKILLYKNYKYMYNMLINSFLLSIQIVFNHSVFGHEGTKNFEITKYVVFL